MRVHWIKRSKYKRDRIASQIYVPTITEIEDTDNIFSTTGSATSGVCSGGYGFNQNNQANQTTNTDLMSIPQLINNINSLENNDRYGHNINRAMLATRADDSRYINYRQLLCGNNPTRYCYYAVGEPCCRYC